MLYNNVKSLCDKRGISISALERDLGLQRSSVCKWNKNEPGVRKVEKVADYLGVPIKEILKTDDPLNNTFVADELAGKKEVK